MKKLLVILIAVMLLISCGVAASAADTDVAIENTDNAYENAEQPNGSNPFSELYRYACEHADNIFSVLAFAGSVVIAFFYKKGLMPALSSALVNLRTSVKSIGDTAEKTLIGNESAYADLKSSIDLVGKGVDTLCIAIGDLDKRLTASEEQYNQMNAMKTIISAQVDMLYSIFMSSSLPQYSKDAVGERIAEMKAALAETITDGE